MNRKKLFRASAAALLAAASLSAVAALPDGVRTGKDGTVVTISAEATLSQANDEATVNLYYTETGKDAAPVGAAVFAALSPDDVGDVPKSPCFHDRKPFGKQGIRYPKVEMRVFRGVCCHRERLNVFERHGGVAPELEVFRRHFAGAVGKTPRWIGEDRSETGFESRDG